MEYSCAAMQYDVDQKMLLQYGFSEQEGVYIYERTLHGGDFRMQAAIREKSLSVQVYDCATGDVYLPFSAVNPGSFTAQIRQEVGKVVDDIMKQCFGHGLMKTKVLEYGRQKYATEPEYPWKGQAAHSTSATLKTAENGKWYGVVMSVPRRCLEGGSEELVNILNVKGDPAGILARIDHRRYFPAYHMNKKHWLTILLDEKADEGDVFALLDESYRLALGQGKKR